VILRRGLETAPESPPGGAEWGLQKLLLTSWSRFWLCWPFFLFLFPKSQAVTSRLGQTVGAYQDRRMIGSGGAGPGFQRSSTCHAGGSSHEDPLPAPERPEHPQRFLLRFKSRPA